MRSSDAQLQLISRALAFLCICQLNDALVYSLRVCRLESTAIWWVGQFISVGMRVLPHSDLSRLSQSDLWQITKGIEEFNAIGE